MKCTKVMKFRELAEKLAQNNCGPSICRLLDIQVLDHESEKVSEGIIPEILLFRLNDTWWEVSWPDGGKINVINEHATYKYIADNIEDLLRLRPDVDLPFWDRAYEYVNGILDDDDYDDLDFYSIPSRFETVSDNWEYLNYDLCGSGLDLN
ncbi:MAG: hypothetical protein K9M75_03315 [Phycisphaerae bacterium]|nr:hypothetical protein [Phycisphaerae bacterium]